MSTPYPKSIDDIGKESTNIRERDPRAVDTTIPVDTKTPDYIKIILGILVILGFLGIIYFKNIKNFIDKILLSKSNYYKL